MSRKRFIWLLLATTLLAVLVLVFPGRTGKESGIEQSAFLPDLAKKVNDISWFRITGAGGETVATLRRVGDSWVVEEASNYRADWSQIKALLAALSQAEVVEKKTSNPDYYARLGVEDIRSPDAGGVMVTFADDSGLAPVIIGNRAQGRSGQYARLQGAETSVLIDSEIDLPGERDDWLDKTIIDIPDAEVVEVRIEHSDGEKVRAARKSADDENLDLQDVPEGRDIKSEWSVNSLANSLAALDLQAVMPATQLNWDGAVKFWELTADGVTVDAELVEIKPEEEDSQPGHWIRLEAGVYSTGMETSADSVDVSDATARASEINSRVSGWAYQIPRYRFETMTQRMENLLQAKTGE